MSAKGQLGAIYSRYGVQGDVTPATSALKARVHVGRSQQGILKAPLNQPRPPAHFTEAPGHIHSQGIGAVPSVPKALLEPGDATEIF